MVGAPCVGRLSAQAWDLPQIHLAAAREPLTEVHVEGWESVFNPVVLSSFPIPVFVKKALSNVID